MKAALKQPIFIVGLPRTGSKLLMNIINNNTLADYHVANEVQFFGHSFLGRILQGRRGIMAIVDSEKDKSGRVHWERVVDRLYSGEARGVHWNGLAAGWLNIPKNRLLQNLSEKDGTPREVYSAVLATQESEHKAYGDKSGPNLYFVDKLLEWYPDGKILHIIRDPRAIMSSQHKRFMLMLEHSGRADRMLTRLKKLCVSPMVVLYILIYWGRAMKIDRRFSQSHPKNYRRIRFETLVSQPEAETKKLCEFLEIPWDPKMVEPPKRDSSYIDPNDIQQKVNRGTGMDQEAAQRWRKHIRPWMKVSIFLYGRLAYPRALRQLGYWDA